MSTGQHKYTEQGLSHVQGQTEQDSARCHHTTQNGTRFKTRESFISGVSHILFLDCGQVQVTEIEHSKTVTKWGLLYFKLRQVDSSFYKNIKTGRQ